MTFDKKFKATFAAWISLINVFLYLLFFSIYIKDETAPIAKVAILYIIAVILLIATYISVQNVQSSNRKIFLSLMVFAIQFGIGLFLTTVWFRPRSDYIIAHPVWLTHLKILAGQHYLGGILILCRTLFKS